MTPKQIDPQQQESGQGWILRALPWPPVVSRGLLWPPMATEKCQEAYVYCAFWNLECSKVEKIKSLLCLLQYIIFYHIIFPRSYRQMPGVNI